jgi:hypothetical protein
VAILRPLMLLAVAGLILSAGDVRAQGAFPAPLPSQSAPGGPQGSPFPPANAAASPFPPPGGGAFGGAPAGPPGGDQCMQKFLPMRQDAEQKAGLIKAASARKAPPEEACKLISNFAAAEVKMISFIETNSNKCGIPPQIGQQMKAGHANTEKLRITVCNVAAQRAQGGGGPAAPSLSEVLGTDVGLPEARATKRGGTTFDTLSGNALDR